MVNILMHLSNCNFKCLTNLSYYMWCLVMFVILCLFLLPRCWVCVGRGRGCRVRTPASWPGSCVPPCSPGSCHSCLPWLPATWSAATSHTTGTTSLFVTYILGVYTLFVTYILGVYTLFVTYILGVYTLFVTYIMMSLTTQLNECCKCLL